MWLNGELEGFSLSHRPLWLGCSFWSPSLRPFIPRGAPPPRRVPTAWLGVGGTAVLGHTPSAARCPGEKGRALRRLKPQPSSLQGQDASLHPCSLRVWSKNISSSLWRGVRHLEKREAEPPVLLLRGGTRGHPGPSNFLRNLRLLCTSTRSQREALDHDLGTVGRKENPFHLSVGK